ncbi:phosphoenolpyruvate-utilizing N-terminal domain-containing protein [Mesoplasma seiffertii]|uniref:phosphoenolpyruvate-utilizing N-terminal domain-containing protein n=1 Tax=Mesoplasma seiffertii TaxID=28224 RepID=UPI00047BBC46|nr:phosphoenolpyruvate-utilizing N-terminal domain-containing protein [Mesoplasma seiffertii]
MFENMYHDRLNQYLRNVDLKIIEELEKIASGEKINTSNLHKLEIAKENILERIAETKSSDVSQDQKNADLEAQLGISFEEITLVEGTSKKVAIPQNKISESGISNEIYNLSQAINAVKNEIKTSLEFEKKTKEAVAILRVLENQTLIDEMKNFINNKHYNAMFSVYMICDKFYKSYKVMKSEESTKTASNIKHTMNLILSELETKGYQTEQAYDGPMAIYTPTLTIKDRALIVNEQTKGFVVRSKPTQEVQVLASANNKFIIMTSKTFADFKSENWSK